jgi:transposase
MGQDNLFDELPEQKAPRPAASEAMGEPRLRRPNREQIGWQAVDIDSLLPADHRARVIWAYVERLELAELHAAIKAREGRPGHPPIDPQLMLALWLYATSEGVGSARALERLCERDVAYRWLCGGVSVNYHTLAAFRVAQAALVDALLVENVAALAAAGVVDLHTLAQDGLRVRAAAGSSSFRRRARIEERLAQARAAVEQLKQEVSADPAASERRLKAARQRAARERQARLAAAEAKLKEIEAEREQQARTHATQTAKQKAPRASTSDPEARRMQMADGGIRPAYNMQIVSAPESQVIVAVDVTTKGKDAGLLQPTLEGLHGRAIRPGRYLADGGFTKAADIEWAAGQGIEVYCPPIKSKHGTDPFAPRPGDGPGVAAWRQRMNSEAGKAVYRRRVEHECINARARQWTLRQLTVRGLNKARAVLLWFALAFNILAEHRLRTAAA